MFSPVIRTGVAAILRDNAKSCKRFFLSDAFKCSEVWKNRLNAPVFGKVHYGQLYEGLDKTLSNDEKVNVLDVDIFASGLTDDSYQQELEEILFHLRKTPETRIVPQRTIHAVVRWYLENNKKADLLNIMCQRLSYGIFPDSYLNILMMDTFLKEDDVISSVKTAVLEMQQEDCDQPLLRTLALYSCIKYLNSPHIWETPKESEDKEDDEVVKVRVSFLRNEYFDDHFDIINTNHLVGKTMIAFGKVVEAPIGISCQLIGSVLYEKFDKLETLLKHLINSDMTVYREALMKLEEYMANKPKQVVEEGKEEPTTEEMQSVMKHIKEIVDSIPTEKILDGNIEAEVKKAVEKEVKENEKNFITQQCETYNKWEKEREDDIATEMANERKRKIIKEIENKKEQLRLEEQKLFLFDNEEEKDMIIQQNIEEREKVVFYKVKRPKDRKPGTEVK